MLHVTNGDHAAGRIRDAGVPGEVIAWRDVLHEGPVPAHLSLADLRPVRARFIADRGWESFHTALREFDRRDATLEACSGDDEIVLWFEHDLYDQLQLIQLLDHFASRRGCTAALTLICDAEYLGESTALSARFEERRPVTEPELMLGRQAWAAFRSPDPTGIGDLLKGDTSALPFLHGALVRLLEQYPSTTNGLSRSEQQGLEALASGAATLREAFAASQAREEREFLGDSVFAHYMTELSRGIHALVAFADGTPVVAEGGVQPEEFWSRPVRVTETGTAVLRGRGDWVDLQGIDRWLGGVHLAGDDATWRWDRATGRLQRAR